MFKKKLRWFLQPTFRRLKIKRYCNFCHSNVRHWIAKYCNTNGGVFFEVGANNGIFQSNTYHLQYIQRWSGILVEPIKILFDQCIKNRPGASLHRAILGTKRQSGETLEIHYAGLMSTVNSQQVNNNNIGNHVMRGCLNENLVTYKESCTVSTISEIIDKSPFTSIDFMSIDVEGFESPVIEGIDFEKHSPKILLIEHSKLNDLSTLLPDYYIKKEFNSYGDLQETLYMKKD